MEKYVANDKSMSINHELELEKERFKILAEMVKELLIQENARDFLESVNSHLVEVIAEKTRKPGESEDTRYSRVEDEVDLRINNRCE